MNDRKMDDRKISPRQAGRWNSFLSSIFLSFPVFDQNHSRTPPIRPFQLVRPISVYS